MKKAIFGFIIIFGIIIFSSCNPKRDYSSHFLSSSDTLIIKTEQVKGFGLLYYLSSIHRFNFKDSLKFEVILPENISDIQLDYELVDYYIDRIITEKNLDSLKILSLKENSVCFLKGLKGKDEILIFDENNNKDFRDDSIRLIKEIDFYSKDNLFKCDYKIFNGSKYVIASNWINFGIFSQRDSVLYYLTTQHYTSRFSIDRVYRIDCVNAN